MYSVNMCNLYMELSAEYPQHWLKYTQKNIVLKSHVFSETENMFLEK